MAHLIDKDALVAEIDRQKIGYNTDGKHSVEYNTIRKILDIIDTLEVKEVGLESEMDKFYGLYRKNGITYDKSDNEICFDWKDDELSEHEMRLAKHFFELSLKAQKGE